MTLAIGTKIRILTDEYYAAGPNYPEEFDILYIKPGDIATVVKPTPEFLAELYEFDEDGTFPAHVEGMQAHDVLFVQPSEEGIAWERV